MYAPDWPEGPTLDASCDAVGVEEEPTLRLVLSCIHPETAVAVDAWLNLPEYLAGQVDGLVGVRGLILSVSFYKNRRGSIGCAHCLDVSVRGSGGELILLSHSTDLWDLVPSEGDGLDVTGPGFLDPGSDAYANWSLPFTAVVLRDIGCNAREPIRPGSIEETPLAFEFAGGEDVVRVYDRNVIHDVTAGGESFDIWVSNAFFRGPLTCGDCPVTEGNFLLVRSPLSR